MKQITTIMWNNFKDNWEIITIIVIIIKNNNNNNNNNNNKNKSINVKYFDIAISEIVRQ